MIIGLLENGNRILHFKDYSKEVTEDEFKQLLKGKTNILTNEEYIEFHFNIEAKRTGDAYALSSVNKEILACQNLK